jgi:serine/threonine-protein kinase
VEEVGGFCIEAVLGRGGTAVVYRARDANGASVALKLLHPELLVHEDVRARARREASALSRVVSPHVVRIIAIGEDDERGPWIATELSSAPRLSDLLAESPSGLSPGRAASIVAQVLDGLHALHAVGVMHRDLKPDNVFVSNRGGSERAFLFDLAGASLSGAAHLTPPGTVMGSPSYVSPERIDGEEGDPRSDVWAAGVLLYECMSGRQPFEGDDLRTLIAAILHGEPTPVAAFVHGIPAELSKIVDRALEKSPDDRFSDAREMGDALREFAASENA